VTMIQLMGSLHRVEMGNIADVSQGTWIPTRSKFGHENASSM
jgi:hypothetical protein